MTDKEAHNIEKDHPEIIIIDSKVKGLRYLFDDDKSRFVIAGKRGMVMLTIKQAEALKDELNDIVELRDFVTSRERKQDK